MNNSTSGQNLVRRVRRTAEDGSEGNNGSSTSTNNDHNDNFKDDADNENMEETSDKETRLTLMEEVLLLGLKDKEVSKNMTICNAGIQNDCILAIIFKQQYKQRK